MSVNYDLNNLLPPPSHQEHHKCKRRRFPWFLSALGPCLLLSSTSFHLSQNGHYLLSNLLSNQAHTATPFLYSLWSSAKKFYYSLFQFRSYPWASLKLWYFVLSVYISKWPPTLTFMSSVCFYRTVAREINSKIHSIPSYIPNQMPLDWK